MRAIKTGYEDYFTDDSPAGIYQGLDRLATELNAWLNTSDAGQSWTGFESVTAGAGHAYWTWVCCISEITPEEIFEDGGRELPEDGFLDLSNEEVIEQWDKMLEALSNDHWLDRISYYGGQDMFDDDGYFDAEGWSNFEVEYFIDKEGMGVDAANERLSEEMRDIGSPTYEYLRNVLKAIRAVTDTIRKEGYHTSY